MHIYPSFTLDNFEGPLELLFYLIQKEEIDPCGIEVKQLTTQLIQVLEKNLEVDLSSEMMLLAASLLFIKSQRLLPHSTETVEEMDEGEARIEMIQSLLEYCQFKEIAKALTEKEVAQKAYYPRPVLSFKKELGNGLEEISYGELKNIFQKVLQRAGSTKSTTIQEDQWRVADKIEWFKEILKTSSIFPFADFFSENIDQQELIVSFLALLELMKQQFLRVVKEGESLYISHYEARD